MNIVGQLLIIRIAGEYVGFEMPKGLSANKNSGDFDLIVKVRSGVLKRGRKIEGMELGKCFGGYY